jgi:nucleoside diphosphate kinase
MTLRACKKCQIVNEDIELYYHEQKWQGPPEYLCVECQKKAFHFYVFMIILGTLTDQAKGEEERMASTRSMIDKIAKHAKRNRIREEYWMKLVEREVAKLKAIREAKKE